MKRAVVHFHTDCAFFAGCENMLVNFWTSPEFRRRFRPSFSYRASPCYTAGLHSRVRVDFPVSPIRFPDLSEPGMLLSWLPLILQRAVMFALRVAITMPLLACEVAVLARVLRRQQPEAVHINCGGYPSALSGSAAAIAARLTGVPRIVMVVNNMAVDYARPARWLDYPLDRLIVRCVTTFVTGSVAASRQLRAVLRLGPSKCVALPNGIALRPSTETTAETRARLGLDTFTGTVFGVVAILRHNKGHRVLLEAISRLQAADPKMTAVKLLIEGHGPLREELEQFARSAGLTESCVFVGDEVNVMNFIAAVDAIVLPSLYGEDFPNVILEAMAMAKPVIASRLAGTPEQVIDGETGLLIEPGDVAGFAAALERFVQDPSLGAEMGRAGRRRFEEHFTAAAAVTRYLPLYGVPSEG